jgi:hypothetical protein
VKSINYTDLIKKKNLFSEQWRHTSTVHHYLKKKKLFSNIIDYQLSASRQSYLSLQEKDKLSHYQDKKKQLLKVET